MPNHVKTIINFHGEDKDIEKVLSLIKGDDMNVDFNKLIPKPESLNIESSSNTERGISLYLTFINPYVQYYGNKEDKMPVVEFLKLISEIQKEKIFYKYEIKMPIEKIKSIVNVQETFNLGQTAVNNFIKYGATTWYEWCINNWGTKWNSYDNQCDNEKLSFSTAWACPFPILNKISEICSENNISFDGQWADEDIGNNTGVFNSTADGICFAYCEPASSSAYKVYCDCWGKSDCIGIDQNGNFYHYDCDSCPNHC